MMKLYKKKRKKKENLPNAEKTKIQKFIKGETNNLL
jgi:hypothetical protein